MTIFAFEFELHRGVSWPIYEFNQATIISNEITHNNDVKTITHTAELTDDVFQLNYNKKSNETVVQHDTIIRDQSLIVKNIYADNILLDCNLLHQISYYEPNYTQNFLDYCNENNIVPDTGPTHNYKFHHSGIWSFSPPTDFWSWYSAARRDHSSKYMNQTDIDLYLGNSVAEHQSAMRELEELLKKYV